MRASVRAASPHEDTMARFHGGRRYMRRWGHALERTYGCAAAAPELLRAENSAAFSRRPQMLAQPGS